MADISIQDSLKYAAEKFVIEFPEFEDLDIDDLYKEMEKKGYFGDEKAKGGEVKKYNKGGKYVGEYKNGEVWNGIVYDKNGDIIGNWVNGVKQ